MLTECGIIAPNFPAENSAMPIDDLAGVIETL